MFSHAIELALKAYLMVNGQLDQLLPEAEP